MKLQDILNEDLLSEVDWKKFDLLRKWKEWTAKREWQNKKTQMQRRKARDVTPLTPEEITQIRKNLYNINISPEEMMADLEKWSEQNPVEPSPEPRLKSVQSDISKYNPVDKPRPNLRLVK